MLTNEIYEGIIKITATVEIKKLERDFQMSKHHLISHREN